MIKDGRLISSAPLVKIDVRLDEIKEIKRTMVPFHIRVGVSFYCGWFYLFGVGWTTAIITNLNDGVLIKTKDGNNYLITPSSPDIFITQLKRMSKAKRRR